MLELTSGDRKFLRSRAHHLKPVVYVGKSAVTDTVVDSADKALAAQELIKVKFNDLKDQKKALTEELAQRTGAGIAGIIGNTAILYRPHEDPEKRRILLPSEP